METTSFYDINFSFPSPMGHNRQLSCKFGGKISQSFAHPNLFRSLEQLENDIVHLQSIENPSHRLTTERERERVLQTLKALLSLCICKTQWVCHFVGDGVGIGSGGSTHTPQSTWSPCKVQVHARSRQDPACHLHWQSFYQSMFFLPYCNNNGLLLLFQFISNWIIVIIWSNQIPFLVSLNLTRLMIMAFSLDFNKAELFSWFLDANVLILLLSLRCSWLVNLEIAQLPMLAFQRCVWFSMDRLVGLSLRFKPILYSKVFSFWK